MAKRKKKATTHHRRSSRRVSGLRGSGMAHELMEVVGLVVGNVGSTIMQRQLTSLNPKLVAVAQMGVGFMVKKHAKSPLIAGIGLGMLSAGAIGITHEAGLIHGVEEFVSGAFGDGDSQGYIDDSQEIRGISNSDYVSGLGNGATVSAVDMIREM